MEITVTQIFNVADLGEEVMPLTKKILKELTDPLYVTTTIYASGWATTISIWNIYGLQIWEGKDPQFVRVVISGVYRTTNIDKVSSLAFSKETLDPTQILTAVFKDIREDRRSLDKEPSVALRAMENKFLK